MGRGIYDFVPLNFNKTPLHVAVEERQTKVAKHSCRISEKFRKDEQKLLKIAKT